MVTSEGRRDGKGRGRRLLQAALLSNLLEQPSHAYELMELLADHFPTAEGPPNASNVYRCLSELETQGVVSSNWEPGEGGGRRTYQITEIGREKLHALLDMLREDHRRLRDFLAQFDELD